MIIIIIILILLITTNLSNKSNVKTTYKIVEGFIEPKNYHAPQDVKLYEVDDDNKLMHFIFRPPRPLIVANQIKEYILVVASYFNDTKGEHIPIETTTYRKNAELLGSKNEMLLKDGYLVFTIKKPQDKYNTDNGISEDSSDNSSDSSDNFKNILFKIGLMAKYPNTHSNITSVSNMEQNSPIPSIFNYSENNVNYNENNQKKLSLTNEIGNLDLENNSSVNSTYEQLKTMLGGFPDNLNSKLDYSELHEMLTNEESDNYKNNMTFNINPKFSTASTQVTAAPTAAPASTQVTAAPTAAPASST